MKCPRCNKRMKLVEAKIYDDRIVTKVDREGKITGEQLITMLRKVWQCKSCEGRK